MAIEVNPPRRMEQHDKIRMRAAAMKVRKLIPGPLGEIVAHEILTWEEFGYRLGQGSVVLAAVNEIMKTPLPPGPAPEDSYRKLMKSAVGYGG